VELRILRFRHVHDVSILSEKVFSFLRMRQLLYFAFGILILWRAMSFRDPGALAFSMFVLLLGMVSAILSRGSCSFEARLVLTILSVIDSVLTPKAPKPSKAVEAEKKRVKNIHASASTISTTTNSIASIVGRVVRSRTLNAVVAATGSALFTLSTLTLFGFKTPLAALGAFGLMVLTCTSAAVGGVGFFMLLTGVLGSPLKRVRR
jgi:hypothetical protein